MKVNWKALRDWRLLGGGKLGGRRTINQRLVILFAVLIGGFVLIKYLL